MDAARKDGISSTNSAEEHVYFAEELDEGGELVGE